VRERVKLTSKYRGYEDVLLGKAFAQFMEQWSNSVVRAVYGVGLLSLACLYCGFESRKRQGWFSREFCQFYSYMPLRRADPLSRGALPSVYVPMCVCVCLCVCVCVISWNNNPLHLCR
jgi:hypothetical protein